LFSVNFVQSKEQNSPDQVSEIGSSCDISLSQSPFPKSNGVDGSGGEASEGRTALIKVKKFPCPNNKLSNPS